VAPSSAENYSLEQEIVSKQGLIFKPAQLPTQTFSSDTIKSESKQQISSNSLSQPESDKFRPKFPPQITATFRPFSSRFTTSTNRPEVGGNIPKILSSRTPPPSNILVDGFIVGNLDSSLSEEEKTSSLRKDLNKENPTKENLGQLISLIIDY
jgi:hypothetical protein